MSILLAWLSSHAVSLGVGAGGALALALLGKWLPGFIKSKIAQEIEELLGKFKEKPHLRNWIVVTAQVIEIEIPDQVDFDSKVEKLIVKYPKLRPLKSALVKVLVLANDAVNDALNGVK